jgi:hypothetical protein
MLRCSRHGADKLLREEDLDGLHNWLLILDRVEQMLAKPKGDLH